jgi:translocation and assembly module TamA
VNSFAGVTVQVTITGLEAELYDNVMSSLTINLQKDSDRLQSAGVRRLHHRANQDIQKALAPYGYYNPTVTGTLVRDGLTWQAQYAITPGEPLLIAEVDLCLEGDGSKNLRLVTGLDEFSLKIGMILDQTVYEKEKRRLINLAISEGFLDAVLSKRELKIHKSTNRGTISLCLDTGAQYLFGETTGGEEILQKSLIDRYLPYNKGDPYSEAKLFELQSILYRTDYFSRVNVKGNKEKNGKYSIPVEIDVSPPTHRNKYSVGAGYATDTGVRGKFDWSNRYFNDKGHRMKGGVLIAELEKTLFLTFEIPRKRPRYEKLVHNLAYQDKTWEDTTTRLITGSVSHEYSGPRFKFSLGLEARDEVYDVGETSGSSILFLPSVNGGMVFADDILNTRKGLQTSAGLIGSIDGFISDATFIQGTANGKIIYTPLQTVRLIGRGSVGVTLVDSIDSLPPSLRFYTGGDSSIRGYSYKSIGTEDASGTVVGGRYLVVGSIEVEKIVGQYWSLAAFWDVGNATDDLSLDFYQGAGLGIRFRLPFGQIRLDVASAITEPDDPVRLHLTVGGDL